MWWRPGKKSPLIAIDISTNAAKLLEVSRNGDDYRVESYAVEPLPLGVISENTIVDIESVGYAVERALRRSETKSNRAIVAVPGSSVITKIVPIPASITDEELESQIILEADQYIPYPLEEVHLDFDVLGVSKRNPEMLDVLMCASRSENVEMRVAALEAAGLEVDIVDVETYAIENAFKFISDQLPEGLARKTIAVADVGSAITTLTIIHDGRTVYSREQVFGGNLLTEEIQQRYGLSREEAGMAKKQGGLPRNYETEVLEPFKDAVAHQISRSLQFFSSSAQQSNIDHILLGGGCAAIKGLDDLVESKVGISTTVANPFLNMSISPKIRIQNLNADAPSMLITLGMCLRNLD